MFGRLDFQANASHRFMLRGNFTEYEGINGTSDAQTRTESYNGIEGLSTDSYVGSWTGQFGINLLNDLNLNYITEDTPRQDKGLDLPEIQLGAFRYGEVAFLPIDPTTTERKAFADTLTYLAGDHVIKAGVEYNDTSIDQVFRGNWRGVFIFTNEADLLAGSWNAVPAVRRPGRPDLGRGRPRQLRPEGAAPCSSRTSGSCRPNLTLQAGVRFESLDNPDEPILNPQRPQRQRLLQADRRGPGHGSHRPDLAPPGPLLGAGREDRGPLLGRPLLEPHPGHPPRPALHLERPARHAVHRHRHPRDAAGNVLQPTDPLSPGWGANWNPQGIERIDFTKVPARARRRACSRSTENFENPYTDRVTLGAEREIFSKTAFGLDFTYAEGKQLQRLTDINRVYDGTTAANGLPRYSSTRPNRFYGRITHSLSDAESEYVALTATLRRRYANNFSLYGSVTWSEDKDNDSNERNFAGIQAEDYNDLDLNWGYSNRDQDWRGVLNGLWDTPWWGIGISGAFRYASGSPFTATTGVDQNNDGEGTTDRPTVGGVHFDRNSFRQPSFYSLDLRLAKDFNIGPGDISVFAECFNCTDADNRFVTDTRWGTGQTPTPTFGQEVGVGVPRTFQLALRYDF